MSRSVAIYCDGREGNPHPRKLIAVLNCDAAGRWYPSRGEQIRTADGWTRPPLRPNVLTWLTEDDREPTAAELAAGIPVRDRYRFACKSCGLKPHYRGEVLYRVLDTLDSDDLSLARLAAMLRS